MLRRGLSSAFALLLLLHPLWRPAPGAAQAALSFQAGLSRSTLYGSAVASGESRKGPHGAVSVTLPLAGWGGLRVGAAYVPRGADFRNPSGAPISIPMELLQLPLTLWVGYPSAARLSVHGFAGIVPGWRVACERVVTASWGTRTCGEPVYVRRLLFEAMGGAGIALRTSDRTLTLDVSYHQGLSSIYDGGAGVKTRALALSAGLDFPLE